LKLRFSAFGKWFLKFMLILAGGTVIGFLLLLGAYAIPVEPIANHVKLSVPALDGSWATGEIAYEQLVKGYLSTQLDNSTDANMLLAAAHDSDRPLVQMAVSPATYTLDGRCYPALLQFGQTGSAGLTSNPIARYWHGYLVVLKPLLCLFSYMDLRMLLTAVQWLAVCAVLAGLTMRGLLRSIPALAISLLVITPSVAGFSLQFSTVYLLFLGLCAVLLFRPSILRARGSLSVYFLIAGMLTSYFDYLTYPIATFGMPFVMVLLLTPPLRRRQALALFALCLGAWFAGYFGLWAGKWLLAAALGEDSWFVANLLAKITERSSYEAEGAAISFISVFKAVFAVYAKKAYLALGAVLAALYAALLARALWRRGRMKRVRQAEPAVCELFPAGERLGYLLTAALPLVWYAFTSNHTYDHAFFTSRALVVTAFAGIAFCLRFLQAQTGRGTDAQAASDVSDERPPLSVERSPKRSKR